MIMMLYRCDANAGGVQNKGRMMWRIRKPQAKDFLKYGSKT